MKRLKFLLLLPLLLVSGCKSKNSLTDTVLVIGCSPTPHAEILKEAAPLFNEKGYKLQIEVLNDYVTPNKLLESGDLDANYFQHVPYLEDFNEKNGTHIVPLVKLHFEPMGVYSKKYVDLTKENPVIAIPNDNSNKERALNLLNVLGISGTLKEVEAQAIPSILQDVDYGVINGNYALSAKITNLCLATESNGSEVALRNANVIAVKESSLKYGWCDVIKEVMTSDKMRAVINTYFGSSVKAVF